MKRTDPNLDERGLPIKSSRKRDLTGSSLLGGSEVPILSPQAVLLEPGRTSKPTRQQEKEAALEAANDTVNAQFVQQCGECGAASLGKKGQAPGGWLPRRERRALARQLAKLVRKTARSESLQSSGLNGQLDSVESNG